VKKRKSYVQAARKPQFMMKKISKTVRMKNELTLISKKKKLELDKHISNNSVFVKAQKINKIKI